MTVSRSNFLWDLILVFLNLAIGRLLPTFHVPNSELTKKTVIITGCNSGIGFQIALKLARRGAKSIWHVATQILQPPKNRQP
ncbi:MAG: hypothetical protein Q9204_006746, partial [Flavoplaca sp. TL-2023a]